jgi:uncharacterized protein YjiK
LTFFTFISGIIAYFTGMNRGLVFVMAFAIMWIDQIRITARWEMPTELTEISGISYVDEQRFACIQDEDGIIFIYNITTKSIERRIPFGGPGDYEGIAVAGETIYVARADGRLFAIKAFNTANPEVKELSTTLSINHNVEGLCFDSENNRLLLATKDIATRKANYKGIFAFDLVSMTCTKEPIYLVDRSFSPSAIGIHPSSKEIYVIDGPQSRLLILDRNGNTNNFLQLDKQDFPQAEGIAFNPEGNLFISNEARKEAATILKVEITN